jgi:signal peptide peptidase SppA
MNDINPILAARLFCEPWLVSAPVLGILAADPITFLRSFMASSGECDHENKLPIMTIDGNIAVIRCEGMLVNKLNCHGVVSTDLLTHAIMQAANNPQVKGIMLMIDSPGGVVTGVPECAAAVRYATDHKPVCAYNDGQMASAAYWIGSQANLVLSTESGRTGSIGAYLAYMDTSKLMQSIGVTVDVIRSAEHKGMGTPGTALSDSDRESLQTRINVLGTTFVNAVRFKRSIENDGFFNGLDFDAATSVNGGLIDGIFTYGGAMNVLADRVKEKVGR